jgi:hypothetical protein
MIEASLKREIRRIIALVEANRIGAGRRKAKAARPEAKKKVKI